MRGADPHDPYLPAPSTQPLPICPLRLTAGERPPQGGGVVSVKERTWPAEAWAPPSTPAPPPQHRAVRAVSLRGQRRPRGRLRALLSLWPPCPTVAPTTQQRQPLGAQTPPQTPGAPWLLCAHLGLPRPPQGREPWCGDLQGGALGRGRAVRASPDSPGREVTRSPSGRRARLRLRVEGRVPGGPRARRSPPS